MEEERKKWQPIEFSAQDKEEAEALIKSLVVNAGLTGDFTDLIQRYLQHVEDLEYFTVTSDGFYATEFPEKVSDPENTLFQLKFRE